MKAKILLVAEVELGGSAQARDAVDALLDSFREAVAPSCEYGITLYQATAEDLAAFSGSGRLGQPDLLIELPDADRSAASPFTHSSVTPI